MQRFILNLSNLNPMTHGGLYTVVVSNPFGAQEFVVDYFTVRLPLEMRAPRIDAGQFWYQPVGNWQQVIPNPSSTSLPQTLPVLPH